MEWLGHNKFIIFSKVYMQIIFITLPFYVTLNFETSWVAQILITLLVPWAHHPPEWLTQGGHPLHLVQRITVDLTVATVVHLLACMARGCFPQRSHEVNIVAADVSSVTWARSSRSTRSSGMILAYFGWNILWPSKENMNKCMVRMNVG